MRWNTEVLECQVSQSWKIQLEIEQSSFKIYLGVNCTSLRYKDSPSTNVETAAIELEQALRG